LAEEEELAFQNIDIAIARSAFELKEYKGGN